MVTLKTSDATPAQDKVSQPKSEAVVTEKKTPVVTEDDNIIFTPEEISVFTDPVAVEILSEAESDTAESQTPASIESDNSNVDQLTSVDMDMSSEEATFEYIN